MDGPRFDQITKTLAGAVSRRDALRATACGAFGATLVGLGLREAGAACAHLEKRCRRNSDCCSKNCTDRRCGCRRGATTCAGATA